MICDGTTDCIWFGIILGSFVSIGILGWFVIIKEKLIKSKLTWVKHRI